MGNLSGVLIAVIFQDTFSVVAQKCTPMSIAAVADTRNSIALLSHKGENMGTFLRTQGKIPFLFPF